ncbi:MAG: amidohydrolase [Fusobacteriaceae bacterium]|jgi:aminobenzoyl-glutamate utilization protein B|nr:amidohydrolase [Fusobacteriaceae bacterium]
MSKTIAEVAKNIWDYAEIRFKEHKSAEELARYAEAAGFTVERGAGGLETAIKASYGSGHPVIAILGEYDSLAGLSQKEDVPRKEKGPQEMNGHGCGHHLLGAGSLLAAQYVKEHLEKSGKPGTVIFYGCPGEEGGSGKAWMIKNGEFKDVDVAITWHPFADNGIYYMSTLANYQAAFRFEGKGSHAAGSPHLGRSALDAVELMDVGCNYLREHIIPEARLHYAITNTGGISPNVVQPEAEVLYLVRAPKLSQVDEIFERVCNVARGAALMTGTTVKLLFEKGTSEYRSNRELEKQLYKNMLKFDDATYNDEELKYLQSFKDTLSESEIESEYGWMAEPAGERWDEFKAMIRDSAAFRGVLPYDPARSRLQPGSTDVGDVSKIIPTGQIRVACYAIGSPGHSWQIVAQGKSSVAIKGMEYAARVMGQTAVDILEDPELLARIRAEFEKTREPYVSPMKYGKDPIAL